MRAITTCASCTAAAGRACSADRGRWPSSSARETAADMEERVLCLKHDVDQGRQFSPPAIWRRLSTPMEHPGAARQDDPDAFQRVLVCSAVGTSSFDLVNWLGERYAAEVVHRRFAGAHALDVGTNYVDFEQGGRGAAGGRDGAAWPQRAATCLHGGLPHLVLLLSRLRPQPATDGAARCGLCDPAQPAGPGGGGEPSRDAHAAPHGGAPLPPAVPAGGRFARAAGELACAGAAAGRVAARGQQPRHRGRGARPWVRPGQQDACGRRRGCWCVRRRPSTGRVRCG